MEGQDPAKAWPWPWPLHLIWFGCSVKCEQTWKTLSCLVMSSLVRIVFCILPGEKKWLIHCLAWKGDCVELEVNLNSWLFLLEVMVLTENVTGPVGVGATMLWAAVLAFCFWMAGKSLLWVHTHSYRWTSAASLCYSMAFRYTVDYLPSSPSSSDDAPCSPQVPVPTPAPSSPNTGPLLFFFCFLSLCVYISLCSLSSISICL